MKVEVLQKFRDIHTGEMHYAGDVMDITEERFQEICGKNKGLVKEIPEVQEEETEEIQEDQLDKLKLEELRTLAKSMGLEETGKKADLIGRILENQGEERDEESEN
jgi:hypothetical protein